MEQKQQQQTRQRMTHLPTSHFSKNKGGGICIYMLFYLSLSYIGLQPIKEIQRIHLIKLCNGFFEWVRFCFKLLSYELRNSGTFCEAKRFIKTFRSVAGFKALTN
jgi:hypothetical protein